MTLLITATLYAFATYLTVTLALYLAKRFNNPWKLTLYPAPHILAADLEAIYSIRQLKSMAADFKVSRYGNLTKAQLSTVLSEVLRGV